MDYKILIDIREKGLIDYFNNKEKYEFKNLDSGDINFYLNGDLKIILERKTIKDLYASIVDGRYKEQKLRLLNNYDKNSIIYLIEGDLEELPENNINPGVLYGSILNMLIRDGIKILNSKNLERTIKIIESIEIRLNKHPEYFGDLKKVDYSETIKVKKKENMNKQTCQIAQLSQIPGISINKAKEILKEYNSIYELMQDLEKDNYIKLENLKINNRKLGKKLLLKLKEYLL